MIGSYEFLTFLYAILKAILMKKGPIILITILLLTAIFIVGMQYGKRVEKADQVLSLLTATVSPSPQPIKETPLTFTEFTHEGCGISFTKPIDFRATKESTLGATLLYNSQIIAFECPAKQVNELVKSDKTTATASVILNNKKIQGYAEGQNVRFIVDHPYKKTPIIFSIDNNLLPLVQSSLEFIK